MPIKNVMFGSNNMKKKHPYRGLAIFTLAAAGVIGIAEKCKKFVNDKMCTMKSMFKHGDKSE